MVGRQLSITSWPARSSKRVKARVDTDPVTDAEAFASKPDHTGFTEMTNQDEANVCGDINEPDKHVAAIGHHRNLATPNCKSITGGLPARTAYDELLNPDPQTGHCKVEVSIVEIGLVSNLVVSTDISIPDPTASEKAKVQYYLLANPSGSSADDSWTLPPLARLPGDSPTRDFVPPWFASQAVTPYGQCPRLTFPTRASKRRICSVVSRSRRKLNLQKTTMRDGLLTKPSHGYRGSDRKTDKLFARSEPDLRIIAGDHDCTHLTAGDYEAPSLAKIRSEWWDTGCINELGTVGKDNTVRLMAGDEIAA
ncbi:hypothetical protein V1517DRAFT_320150 [Lipomyces orientalis]|uniref:Uncharacterized protein n=1 Tax=Lipomyces orientalis TaxID=1233043 RepID=A0ACC3TQY3_9ASCO